MGKKNIPCNLNESEAREAFEQFDQWLDQKEEELVIETLPNYLFYEGDCSGKIRDCICTHANCGKFTMEKKYEPKFFQHKHGDKITCPVCSNDVKLVAMGRMQNFSTLNQERWVRVTLCREGKDGALLLLSGYAHREYSHYDLKPPPEIAWKCMTYLAPGKRGQWEHMWTRDYQNQQGYWAWGLRKTVGEPFSPGGFCYMQHDGDSWFLHPEAITTSALRYCQLEEYMYQEAKIFLDVMQEPVRMATKYLAYYTRYPTMEMAVKLGLGKAVTELIADGKKNHRDLNWDATTIQGFLRLDKQDSKVFHHYGGGLPMLQSYHKAKKYGLTPNMRSFVEQLIAAEAMEHVERMVETAVRADQTIQVAANYIAKFRPTLNGVQVLTLWGDYLNMARVLGYDLTRRDVVMPKDLQDRHDAASETLRLQKVTVDEKKYADFNKFLRKMYEFEYPCMNER